MTTSRPPRFADWLLQQVTSGQKGQSLIGDLHEQYQRRRSNLWYWRQALSAMLTALAEETRRHTIMAMAIVVLGVNLDRAYQYLIWPLAIRVDRLWYPHLIDSRWSGIVIDPWAYRLQPYFWTSWVIYCVFLTVVAGTCVRWHVRSRALIATLLVITQMASFLPHLWTSWTNWDPANPRWIFSTLWFSLFSLVAVPVSLFLGAKVTGRSVPAHR